MKPVLNHVALNVTDFEWYKNFFETVCEMQSYQTKGEAPARHIWYKEGIQLNECMEEEGPINVFDHLCLDCPQVYEFVAEAIAAGCSPIEGKGHWFALPNGIKVEVKNYQK